LIDAEKKKSERALNDANAQAKKVNIAKDNEIVRLMEKIDNMKDQIDSMKKKKMKRYLLDKVKMIGKEKRNETKEKKNGKRNFKNQEGI